MNKVQQFLVAAALMLALSFPAFAGDILCPGITSQPTQQTSSSTVDTQTQDASVSGQMDTPGLADTDSMIAMAMALMVGPLSIF
jgi:hypothetical protein